MKNLNLFMCCAFAVMSCSSDFPTYNDVKKQPEPVQAKTANEFLNSMGVCAGIDGRGETVEPSAVIIWGLPHAINMWEYAGCVPERKALIGAIRMNSQHRARN